MWVQAECGKQKLEAELLLGMSFGLGPCQPEMSPSCVAEPSAPASSRGVSFLAGLGLIVRHPPYLKLVISFLFISAAVQVPLPRLIPIGSVVSSSHQLRLEFYRERPVAGMWPREAGAGERPREWFR